MLTSGSSFTLGLLGLISNLHLRYGILIVRVASKIPTKLMDLPYEERLQIWGITSFEERRTREDQIQTYKVVNGLESYNWYSGFQFV